MRQPGWGEPLKHGIPGIQVLTDEQRTEREQLIAQKALDRLEHKKKHEEQGQCLASD
jgi:hypothetical protein